MSLPILTLVFDRKKQATNKKPASVELRITHYKTQKYLSTGIRLYAKEWQNGMVVRRDDAAELQETLEIFVKNARNAINEMAKEGYISLDEVKQRMEAMQKRGRTFMDFMQERTEIRKYGKSADTGERYDRFLRFMTRWGKIVTFADVNESNVLALDKLLISQKMKPYSRWNNYHRFLNSFILDAIGEGLMKRNPYKWLSIDKEKTSGLRKYLTKDEIDRIRKAKMPTDSLERVRDLFVFQTYTMLSYVDLANFDMSKVEQMNGVQIYTSCRGKTKQEFSFVLLKPARDILNKYHWRLPIISNVKYNEYLKLVAQSAKIDKPITSHWARHTGATLLLNEGKIDMEVIAKVLGHSSTRQTRETYAAMMKKTIADEMMKLDGKI